MEVSDLNVRIPYIALLVSKLRKVAFLPLLTCILRHTLHCLAYHR